MELDIKQILSEYSKIQYNKESLYNSLLTEDSASLKDKIKSYGFGYGKKGESVIDGLESSFLPSVEMMINQLYKKKCEAFFTSGRRSAQKNKKSLHIPGLALDFVFYKNEAKRCVSEMTTICKSVAQSYPEFKCLNEYPEYGGRKSLDWESSHYHVQYGVFSNNSTIKTGDGDIIPDEFTTYIAGKVLNPLKGENKIINSDGILLNEDLNFGRKSQQMDDIVVIPSNQNKEIKSPIDGIVLSEKINSSCENEINIRGGDTQLQYCNMSNVSVRGGSRVKKGQIIGESTDNNDVIVYVTSLGSGTSNNKKETNKEYQKKQNETDEEYEKRMKEYKKEQRREELRTTGDPLAYALVSWPFDLYRHLKKKKEKNKEKKINENIQRIKKLL